MEKYLDAKTRKELNVLLWFYYKQKGIFCVTDLQKGLNVSRATASSEINHLKNIGILEEIDKKEARRILKKHHKLGQFQYYHITLTGEFAKDWFDNKRVIAIDILKQDFGKEFLKVRKRLIKKISNPILKKSCLKELKAL